jgi:UDP-N-acetylglucosamine 2-epimerase (non-hydrolysing)
MPEEINRLVTDAIADVLWTPSSDADENLRAEGVPTEKIERIGNIMLDSFEMLREQIDASEAAIELRLPGEFALVTLHRPSNVDTESDLQQIIKTLLRVAKKVPVVFVAHPRTIKNLEKFGLRNVLENDQSVLLVDPLPYVDFMHLVTRSRLVITDSGGLQEETTYLGIPCLTMRENTERPITITEGTNRLVNSMTLEENVDRVLSGDWNQGSRPDLWDGKTAERALRFLAQRIA